MESTSSPNLSPDKFSGPEFLMLCVYVISVVCMLRFSSIGSRRCYRPAFAITAVFSLIRGGCGGARLSSCLLLLCAVAARGRARRSYRYAKSLFNILTHLSNV